MSILTIKGRELWNRPDPFRDLISRRVHANKRTRILLQYPDTAFIDTSILRAYPTWPTEKHYRGDIAASSRNLVAMFGTSQGEHFEIAWYDAASYAKLFMFDDEIFVSFYDAVRPNGDRVSLPGVWQMKRQTGQSDVVSLLESHFEVLWRARKSMSERPRRLSIACGAVCETHDGKIVFVEESRPDEGTTINQPVGALEVDEDVFEATKREVREETGLEIELTHFLGAYVWLIDNTTTSIRFCFVGRVKGGELKATHQDNEATVTPKLVPKNEIESIAHRFRNPVTNRCMQDFLSGKQYPLDSVQTLVGGLDMTV